MYRLKYLISAVNDNNVELIDFLLSHGIDANTNLESGKTLLMKFIIERKDVNVIKLLIKYGAEISIKDELGFTPLHWASMTGQYETTKLFLENGAEIDARDKYEYTPLIKMLSKSNKNCIESINIVKLLLENGADINAKNKFKWTPLHWASTKNCDAMVTSSRKWC